MGTRMPGSRRAPVERIPCASGPRPVAIVVHTMAGTCSGSARSTAWAPPVRSARRWGISPRAIIWSAMRRSRPSTPRTRTRQPRRHDREIGSGGGGGAGQVGGGGDGAPEQEGGGDQERHHAPARQARLGKPVAHPARGEHGDGRERAEAAEGGAQGDPERDGKHLRHAGARPRHGRATRARRSRGRRCPARARRSGSPSVPDAAAAAGPTSPRPGRRGTWPAPSPARGRSRGRGRGRRDRAARDAGGDRRRRRRG